jgi:hypothetical protein
VSDCCPFVFIRDRIFSRTPLDQFRRKLGGSVGADGRYSTPLAPFHLQSFLSFSESDERHSFFDSSAKGTARLPAVWIGVTYRTQSVSKLSACSGSGRSGSCATRGGDA